MTQTSGITYGFYGDSLVRKAYAKAPTSMPAISTMPSSPSGSRSCRCAISRARCGNTAIPPIFSAASWRSCRENRCLQFEKEKLLDPLGMNDTGFYVTDPEKLKLIAQPMPNDSDFRVGFRAYADVADEMGIRRRRHGLDHGGLCAVFADAAQWRQARRQAISQPEGVRVDDDGSDRAGVRRRSAIISIFPATVSASGSVLACAPIPATPSRRRRARWAN